LDEKLELDVLMDIFSIIDEYPSIEKIVLTSSSGKVNALKWFIKYPIPKKHISNSSKEEKTIIV
jgi:hypothetical protein